MKIPISHPNLKSQPTDRKFTKDEVKFIQFMEEDDDLEHHIESARNKAKIPAGGFNLDVPISKYNETGAFQKMDLNKVYDEAETIHLILYSHVPKYWITTLIPLIVFNVALPPQRREVEPIEIQYTENDIKILIKRRVTRKDIVNFLTKNKDVLDKHLINLPKRTTMPSIKVQDMTLFKKIRQLK